MSIELAMTLSLGLLATLAGATWYLTPKQSEISQARNLAWSKYCEKQVTLELEFHERLNHIYTPPKSGIVVESQVDIYGGIRSLANHYVEERDSLLSRREKIQTIGRSISRIRQLQIGNFVFYVLMMVVVLLFHSEGFSRWWLYALIWGFPWLVLVVLNAKQTRLVRSYDEE